MKRWTVLILVLLCAAAVLPLSAFAGDIPESLLHSEDAQIFFGEVLAYHPDKENPDIVVSPVAVVKGDVQEGSRQVYYRPHAMGGFPVLPGKVYLFTCYDDVNDTDIFEVTTYNTRTLKLRHVRGSMWDRFERYLNQGKYGHAKVEGTMPYTVDMILGAVGAAVGLSVIRLLLLRGKKKKQTGA